MKSFKHVVLGIALAAGTIFAYIHFWHVIYDQMRVFKQLKEVKREAEWEYNKVVASYVEVVTEKYGKEIDRRPATPEEIKRHATYKKYKHLIWHGFLVIFIFFLIIGVTFKIMFGCFMLIAYGVWLANENGNENRSNLSF